MKAIIGLILKDYIGMQNFVIYLFPVPLLTEFDVIIG